MAQGKQAMTDRRTDRMDGDKREVWFEVMEASGRSEYLGGCLELCGCSSGNLDQREVPQGPGGDRKIE